MENAHEEATKIKNVRNRDWLDSPWDDFFRNKDPSKLLPTGVEKDNIAQIVDKFSSVPEGFHIHRGLEKVFRDRKKMFEGNSLDWAIGEALAFGTLLKEGEFIWPDFISCLRHSCSLVGSGRRAWHFFASSSRFARPEDRSESLQSIERS